MKHISSRDNPHFKALKKLCQSGRERRKAGQILLDGLHLIQSHTEHLGRVAEVILSESGSLRPEIRRFLESSVVANAFSVLSDALFDDLAMVDTPSGIMAIVPQPRCTHGINQEIDTVVLDGVQDPGNLGSILRSAAASGFRQVILSGDCAQAWSPKTLRAGMGAHFHLDIHETSDVLAFLAGYRGQSVSTALDASSDLYELDLKTPVAWVFGSEGRGVRPEISESTRFRARISMPGAVESLNVGAAAAICLFESVRQRRMAR